MRLIVNTHKIEIEKEPINEKEINITKCQFEFAEEITDGYVKEAYFTLNGKTYKQIIINNQCDIPYEVLNKQGQVEIGVVAYLVENEEEIKRYNPSPAYFNTWIGSLKDNAENSEPITPSDKEQMQQALNNGLNDIGEALTDLQDKVDSGYFKGDKGDRGEQGIQGEKGDIGAKGDKGDKGDKGEPGQIKYVFVNQLPQVGEEDTWYFVSKEESQAGNLYDEYVWLNNSWELVGEKQIEVDLSDYALKSEIPTQLNQLNEDSTHRTVTDIEKKTWSDKSNFSGNYNDLENKPTNVSTFANDASYLTQHQDVSGKEDKDNKVTSLSSSSTDTQYPSAKCMYDSQELQNATITALNNELERYKTIVNAMPKATGNGTNITLENCANSLMSIDVKGNTEQNGTPTPDSPVEVETVAGDNTIKIVGKNLLNLTLGATTVNGVTFTRNSDGTYTANGKATGGYTGFYEFGTIKFKENTVITYSGAPSGASLSTYSFNLKKIVNNQETWQNDDIGNGQTITAEANAIYSVRFVIRDGVTVDNIVFKPMIELGDTKTSFEPYKSQTYEVNLGKNLFDKTEDILTSYTYTNSGELTPLNNAFVQETYIPVKSSKQYTLSTTNNYSSETDYRLVICEYDANKNFIKRNLNSSDKQYTITTDANTKYVRLCASTVTINELQFELGSATSYAPYFTPIELCKIGDYQDFPFHAENGDKYYDSLTSEQKNALTYGKWYVHKEINKIILDGSENWVQALSNIWGTNAYVYTDLSNFKQWESSYSNYFKDAGITVGRILTNGELAIATSGIVLKNDSATSVVDLKTWLSTHNVIVYYVLATPTNIEITDTTLINQLETLNSLIAYDGTNNISSENSDSNAPIIMNATALEKIPNQA